MRGKKTWVIPRLDAFGEEWRDVQMDKGAYWDGGVAIRLFSSDGELLSIPTVNLKDEYGHSPAPGAFFLKGYTENEGLVDELVRRGVVERTGRRVEFGPYDAFAEECRFVGEYAE
jgi:hypothetical protein